MGESPDQRALPVYGRTQAQQNETDEVFRSRRGVQPPRHYRRAATNSLSPVYRCQVAEDGAAWKISTRLNVVGFSGEASEITRVLRIEPTKTWREGDLRDPKATIKHRDNGWSLKSPVDPHHTTPGESVAALLAVLPDLEAFNRLPTEAEVWLSCTIYGLTERPYFELSAESLAKLASIRASLDVDTYDLTSASEEDTVATRPRRGDSKPRGI